jgi:hypothetical protein
MSHRAANELNRSSVRALHEPGAKSTSRLDVFGGMAFSNLVMFAIIVATAETLHAHGRLVNGNTAKILG